jgi:16S rRNA G966 N2-methylase RsmD
MSTVHIAQTPDTATGLQPVAPIRIEDALHGLAVPEQRMFLLDQARQYLAQTTDLGAAIAFRNLGDELRHNKAILDAGLDAKNAAVELMLRAERRAGELLLEMPRQQRGGDRKSMSEVRTLISKPTLTELGVDRRVASEWQRNAKLPQAVFDAHIAHVSESRGNLTGDGVRKLAAREERREAQREGTTAFAAAQKREAKEEQRLILKATNLPGRRMDLFPGRFQDSPIEDGSLDWIICDPPYGTQYIELYEEFSAWAARKLRPQGSLLAMTGVGGFQTLLPALCRSLKYIWTLGYFLKPGSPYRQMPAIHIVSGWKPVFWVSNSSRPAMPYTTADTYISATVERDKNNHAWQQSQEFFDWLVDRFTLNTETICDPFLGSGTTALSCVHYGRHFMGCEVDHDVMRQARERIEAYRSIRQDRTSA